MEIPALVFLILVAVGIIILCVLSVKEEIEQKQILKAAFDIFTIIAMFCGIAMCAEGIRREIVSDEHRYHASKYHIETEITTRGNVSDTTYVITRK